ncbi:hypothetical protein GGTG_14393 [Gaeumannomyces tritici R3-111a-1]|uniref:Uncharacterized protein n=1 Tax=Gaeumannomyces tritici (strain R3-111a-1) TaxID=644352 RepID=J3PLC9_GAET3|nr:hypothetical protein GGTG_14393 [Gaeumannomyces tritici R3-111a-1]EJT68027.1 hypothetical protein GGTG_14393 [Gaeumannomyces tritici R3-111a-1]
MEASLLVSRQTRSVSLFYEDRLYRGNQQALDRKHYKQLDMTTWKDFLTVGTESPAKVYTRFRALAVFFAGAPRSFFPKRADVPNGPKDMTRPDI